MTEWNRSGQQHWKAQTELLSQPGRKKAGTAKKSWVPDNNLHACLVTVKVGTVNMELCLWSLCQMLRGKHARTVKTWERGHKHEQILWFIFTNNNDRSQSLERGMVVYLCVGEEVVPGNENVRRKSAGEYWLTHNVARYINPSFGILLVQKSPNDAIRTDLKVLCLYMGTYTAFEEIFCSFHFCEAFPFKFNLYLSLFTSNYVLGSAVYSEQSWYWHFWRGIYKHDSCSHTCEKWSLKICLTVGKRHSP